MSTGKTGNQNPGPTGLDTHSTHHMTPIRGAIVSPLRSTDVPPTGMSLVWLAPRILGGGLDERQKSHMRSWDMENPGQLSPPAPG